MLTSEKLEIIFLTINYEENVFIHMKNNILKSHYIHQRILRKGAYKETVMIINIKTKYHFIHKVFSIGQNIDFVPI